MDWIQIILIKKLENLFWLIHQIILGLLKLIFYDIIEFLQINFY